MATTDLQRPTNARKDATDTFVFRLSELMFGSLLAAYVLGFITFCAGLAPVPTPVDSTAPTATLAVGALTIQVIRYIAISTAFAYLTAAFYVSYNFGILTMPTVRFSRLRFDFMIALMQGVFFGISMVYPLSFPVVIGVLLAATSIRQKVEYKSLVESFLNYFRNSGMLRREEKEQEKFEKRFLLCLRQFDSLSAWLPLRRANESVGYVLVALGLVLIYGRLISSWPSWAVPDLPFIQRGLTDNAVVIADIALAGIVISKGHGVLKGRNVPLYQDATRANLMDEEFEQFVEALKSGTKAQQS